MKTVLVVMDGVGLDNKFLGKNAFKTAKTPNLDKWMKENSYCKLKAAGSSVGLPDGYIGNSEVGHLNLGAGRIVKQTITRINESISDGSFKEKKELYSMVKYVKKHNSSLHIMGLLSDAGVHSHIDHLIALIDWAREAGINYVKLHLFTDGRDVDQKSALKYLKILKKHLKHEKIVTVSGRYYAMDRDNRWQRTRMAFETILGVHGKTALSAIAAINNAYKRGETDEFILPTMIKGYGGLRSNDGVIFLNFREDRARQLTSAIAFNDFDKFMKIKNPEVKFLCMYEYDDNFKLPVIFKKEIIKNTLADMISKSNLKQLHIAETEKFAHVTYFFNGGSEKKHNGEDQVIIPSPKVDFYDKTPEMSAAKITDYVLEHVSEYDFVVINYANGDMVGHTGNFEATIKSMEFLDLELGKLVEKCRELKYAVLITADHGNCEDMKGAHATTHTTNDVPCILIGKDVKLKDGILGNVAPTVLKLMKIKKPKEMIDSLY